MDNRLSWTTGRYDDTGGWISPGQHLLEMDRADRNLKVTGNALTTPVRLYDLSCDVGDLRFWAPSGWDTYCYEYIWSTEEELEVAVHFREGLNGIDSLEGDLDCFFSTDWELLSKPLLKIPHFLEWPVDAPYSPGVSSGTSDDLIALIADWTANLARYVDVDSMRADIRDIETSLR